MFVVCLGVLFGWMSFGFCICDCFGWVFSDVVVWAFLGFGVVIVLYDV